MGFMGSGKSWLGKRLASELKCAFYDLDKLMETELNMSVDDAFRLHGEEYFRKKESELLTGFESKENFVLALGGGTACNQKNIDFILRSFLSLYLKVSPKILASRIENSNTIRPLVKNKKGEELEHFVIDLLAVRAHFYSQAHIEVNAHSPKNKAFIQEVKDEILNYYSKKN